jgi:MFS transporter, SP family, sugar:H+ symporter
LLEILSSVTTLSSIFIIRIAFRSYVDPHKVKFIVLIAVQQNNMFEGNIEKANQNTNQVRTDFDENNNQQNEKEAIQYGKPYTAVLLAAFASLGGWFFGYDQGVSGGIVVMSSFKNDFCVNIYGDERECDLPVAALPSEYRRFLVLFTLLYNVGCFIGAVFISSYVAERFGRRAIIFLASILFLTGTSMVIFPPGGSKNIMILILIGRIIEGTGVGCSSFSCPLYASEIAPTKLRGMLSGFMQFTVVIGLFVANVVNLFLKDHKWGWRLSNGIILIAPIIIMIGIFFCPETPRWLFKQKGREASEKSLKRIRKIDDVSAELDAINDAIQAESHQVSIKELFTTKKILKRLGIGVGIHILQQATGINPIFTFGGIIFESVLGNGILSLLILAGANLISTIPALFLFDRLGRRNLLMFCGIAMSISHLAAATVFVTGCDVMKSVINGTTVMQEIVNCKASSGILMLVFTVIFVAFFALSWGPIAWIYAAEIYPLNFRAKAVSITTGSNWFMGTIMSYILELISPLGIHGVFYLFGGLTLLAVIFVYLFCPETRGVILENIDREFENFQLKNRTLVKILRKTCQKNRIGSSSVDILEIN